MIRTARFLQAAAVVFVVVLLVGAAERLGCGPDVTSDGAEGDVTFVYDGDTVEVSGLGKVRLLGVDALDSRNRSKVQSQARHLDMTVEQVTSWAVKAEEFVRQKLQDRRVRLEFGPERRGDHGRLLAYVYIESEGERVNVNKLLLRKGFATAYRAFDHPLKQKFLEVERQARRDENGLWKDASSTW